MHLSKELQKHLKRIGSSIELGAVNNETPSKYAFYYPKKERNFRLEFGKTVDEYSIVFLIRPEERKYEICYLRGIFTSLEKLAKSIKLWVEKEEDIDVMANRFQELERFVFDSNKHPNPKIEECWMYVKNDVFNSTRFWKKRNWEKRYYKLIREAKMKKEWENYYPFIDLERLRFSKNYELTEMWEYGIDIIPTFTKGEGDFNFSNPKALNDEGGYYVGVLQSENEEGYFFKELNKAIEFFEKKLNEYQSKKLE